jgi:hypothetical protein
VLILKGVRLTRLESPDVTLQARDKQQHRKTAHPYLHSIAAPEVKGIQDRFAIEIMAESALSLRAVGRPRLRLQEPPPEAKSREVRSEELRGRDG